MIFRIINGEKKLFAEVNKLEAVNFKKYTGNKTEDNLKNLVLDASNIPFDLAEVTTVDKDWNVDSEGDSRGLSVRDYIDDLRDDLAELDERTNNLDYVRMDRIAIQGGHTRKALLNALAVGVDSPAKPTEITITQFTSFVDDAAGTKEDTFTIKAGDEIEFSLEAGASHNPDVLLNVSKSFIGRVEDLEDDYIGKSIITKSEHPLPEFKDKRFIVTAVEPDFARGSEDKIDLTMHMVDVDSGQPQIAQVSLVGGDGIKFDYDFLEDDGATPKLKPEIIIHNEYAAMIRQLNAEAIRSIHTGGVQGNANYKIHAGSLENGGHISIFGNDIALAPGRPNQFVTGQIDNLNRKTVVRPEDQVLVWEDNGLRTELSLEQTGPDVLTLFGKEVTDTTDPENPVVTKANLGTVNLTLGSTLAYAQVCVLNEHGAWDIPDDEHLPEGIKKDDIIGAAEQFLGTTPAKGQYLVLGFLDAHDNLQYSFTCLAKIFEAFHAGWGIKIHERTVNGKVESNIISINRDPNSTYELSTSRQGLKYTTWCDTLEKFQEDIKPEENDKSFDGVYYITDDAEILDPLEP